MSTSNVFASLSIDTEEERVLSKVVGVQELSDCAEERGKVAERVVGGSMEDGGTNADEVVSNEGRLPLSPKVFVYTREELISLYRLDYPLPDDCKDHSDLISKDVVKPFFLQSHMVHHSEERGGHERHTRGSATPGYRNRNESSNAHSRFAQDHVWEGDNTFKFIGSLPELTSRIQDGEKAWKSNRHSNKRDEFRPSRQGVRTDRARFKSKWDWVTNCNEWYYRDMKDQIQGPWRSSDMNAWLCHFQPTLQMGPKDSFHLLGDLMVGFGANPFQPSESLEQVMKRLEDCPLRTFLSAHLTRVGQKGFKTKSMATDVRSVSNVSESSSPDERAGMGISDSVFIEDVHNDEIGPKEVAVDPTPRNFAPQSSKGESIDIAEIFDSLNISNQKIPFDSHLRSDDVGMRYYPCPRGVDVDLKGVADPNQSDSSGQQDIFNPQLFSIFQSQQYVDAAKEKSTMHMDNQNAYEHASSAFYGIREKFMEDGGFSSLFDVNRGYSGADSLGVRGNDADGRARNSTSGNVVGGSLPTATERNVRAWNGYGDGAWVVPSSSAFSVSFDSIQREQMMSQQQSSVMENKSPISFGVGNGGNVQSGNVQSGNIQGGNIQSGNIQVADILPQKSQPLQACSGGKSIKYLSLLEIQKEELKRNRNAPSPDTNFTQAKDHETTTKSSFLGWNRVVGVEDPKKPSSFTTSVPPPSHRGNKTTPERTFDDDEFPMLGGIPSRPLPNRK